MSRNRLSSLPEDMSALAALRQLNVEDNFFRSVERLASECVATLAHVP